jgi:hypothetical protein
MFWQRIWQKFWCRLWGDGRVSQHLAVLTLHFPLAVAVAWGVFRVPHDRANDPAVHVSDKEQLRLDLQLAVNVRRRVIAWSNQTALMPKLDDSLTMSGNEGANGH